MWCLYYLLIMLMLNVIAYEDFVTIDIENNIDIYMLNLPTIYNGRNGTLSYDKDIDILIFKCLSSNPITDIFPPLKEALSVKQICIRCILPVKPIVQIFVELNINVTAVETLIISSRSMDVLPQGNYTENLNIKTLWIDAPYADKRNFLMHNTNFMEPLKNLTTLILTGMTLPQLPPELRLKVLSVRDNTIISTWDRYCRDLEELSIRRINYNDVPAEWPKNCSQLSSLRLKGLHSGTTERILSSGINFSCESLQSLEVYACNMDFFPHTVLNVAKDIKRVNMSLNRLFDKELQNIPFLQNLTYLDLSKNKLTGWALFDMVEKLPSLRELHLDDNNFFNLFCNYETRIQHFTAHTTALEILSLNGMPMKADCFKNAKFTNLKYLSMAFSGNVTLKLQDLPMTNAKNFEVDLRNRHVEYILFFLHDYHTLLKGNTSGFWGFDQKTNLTIYITSIDCDCKNFWFASALRNVSKFVSMPGLICSNSGNELINEPIENIDCSKEVFPYGCIQRFAEFTTSYGARPRERSVECHNIQTEMSEFPILKNGLRFVSVNVTDNWIESLKFLQSTNFLKWIDLRRNRISRLDQNDTTKLFANPKLRIWLGQNLFVCDCDNAVMLDAFHSHRNQIEDFDELLCIDSDRLLKSVTTYEVCKYGLRSKLTAGGVLAALVFITAAVLWRYRLQVQIYLYSRGWCLFCLTEEDLDSDRPYDAFLSFSHGDEAYVMEQLLPKLESEPYNYSICVHFRDWVVGDWIPTQIMRSVSESKRTIVVLSRNFIESMWGNLEFKYAVANAAQENRSRLLVLVLDDVLSDDLDPELKGYLSYNTYLRCDDPWFCEKLQYAMPRRRKI